MEYISNDHVLPVPLNLVRIPRAMIEWCCDCCDPEEEDELEDQQEVTMNGKNVGKNFSAPITKNGVEVCTVFYAHKCIIKN